MIDTDLTQNSPEEQSEQPTWWDGASRERIKKYFNDGVDMNDVTDKEIYIALNFYECFTGDMKVDLADFRSLERLLSGGTIKESLSSHNVFHIARYQGAIYGLGFMDTDSKSFTMNALEIPAGSLFFDKFLETVNYGYVKAVYTYLMMMNSCAFDHQLFESFRFDYKKINVSGLYCQMRDMQAQIHNIVKGIGTHASSCFPILDGIIASLEVHGSEYVQHHDLLHKLSVDVANQLEFLSTVSTPTDVFTIKDACEKVQEIKLRLKAIKFELERKDNPMAHRVVDESIRFLHPVAVGIH